MTQAYLLPTYPQDLRRGLGIKITRTGGTFTVGIDPDYFAGLPGGNPVTVNGRQGPNITLTASDVGAPTSAQLSTGLAAKANLAGAPFTGPISGPSAAFSDEVTVRGRPVKKYGPRELLVTQDLIDSGSVNAAISNFITTVPGSKKVIIPADVSDHDGISFIGGSNVEVFFDGPNLRLRSPVPASGILDSSYNWKNGLFINNMVGVTFTGQATFGHDNLPFTQGTVIADNGDGTVNVQIDGGFRTDFRYIDGFFGADGNGLLDSGGNGQPQTLTLLNSTTLRVPKMGSVVGSPYAVGKRVVLEHKKYAAEHILGYSNTDMRWLGNFNISSSSSTGATFNYGAGEQDVSGLRIKRVAGRLLSVNADGIQFNSNRGGTVRMRRTLLEGMADDCLHVFTGQYVIDSIDYTLRRIYFKTNGFPPPGYMNGGYPEVRFIAYDGTPRDGYAYIQSSGSNSTLWWVDVSAIPAGVGAPDAMVNNSLLPQQVVVQESELARNWGNGIRNSSGNLTVESCLFAQNLFSGIVIAPAPTFSQGAPTSGLKIHGNEFRSCQRSTAPQTNDYFPVAIGIYNLQRDASLSSSIGHQSISIQGNWIRGCSGGGIFVHACSKTSITDNHFVDNHYAIGNPNDGFNTRRFDISLLNTYQVIVSGNINLNNNGVISTIGGTQSVIYGTNPGMTTTST